MIDFRFSGTCRQKIREPADVICLPCIGVFRRFKVAHLTNSGILYYKVPEPPLCCPHNREKKIRRTGSKRTKQPIVRIARGWDRLRSRMAGAAVGWVYLLPSMGFKTFVSEEAKPGTSIWCRGDDQAAHCVTEVHTGTIIKEIEYLF